jgi:hypothetical protein
VSVCLCVSVITCIYMCECVCVCECQRIYSCECVCVCLYTSHVIHFTHTGALQGRDSLLRSGCQEKVEHSGRHRCVCVCVCMCVCIYICQEKVVHFGCHRCVCVCVYVCQKSNILDVTGVYVCVWCVWMGVYFWLYAHTPSYSLSLSHTYTHTHIHTYTHTHTQLLTAIVLANLCVSYIMTGRNKEAEVLMKSIENAEDRLQREEVCMCICACVCEDI